MTWSYTLTSIYRSGWFIRTQQGHFACFILSLKDNTCCVNMMNKFLSAWFFFLFDLILIYTYFMFAKPTFQFCISIKSYMSLLIFSFGYSLYFFGLWKLINLCTLRIFFYSVKIWKALIFFDHVHVIQKVRKNSLCVSAKHFRMCTSAKCHTSSVIHRDETNFPFFYLGKLNTV